MAAHHNSIKNLRPAKPGDVRNPKGHNQYTYRKDFEKHIDDLCREMVNNKEPRAKVLARKALELAEEGDSRALTEVLARMWPKTERHEHRFPDGGTVHVDTEPERLDEVTEILDDAKALH